MWYFLLLHNNKFHYARKESIMSLYFKSIKPQIKFSLLVLVWIQCFQCCVFLFFFFFWHAFKEIVWLLFMNSSRTI